MSDATTQPPADVRERIIRASILPIEDEETMIAGLRAGAEAVERGELDVDDFVGVWSQYLRELFRRASSVPAPADVRELAVEIIRSLDLIARNYDSYEYGLPVMTHYNEMVDTVVALLRTPRGEGERVQGAWATVEAAALAWADLLDSNFVGQRAQAAEIRNAVAHVAAFLRAPRCEGEEDGGELCDLCGEEFNPSESGTVIGPLGQDDGVPRWYRCPRCARAYDAGYQQGQRDPRGDETADPTASRSDAQGEEDRWEDLIFGTLIEAHNEAQRAARRGEGGGDGD